MHLTTLQLWLNTQFWRDKLRLWYSRFENIILVENTYPWVRVCPRFACRFTKGVCVQKSVCKLHKETNWEDEQYYYTDCSGCKNYKVSCIGKFFLTESDKESAYKAATSDVN